MIEATDTSTELNDLMFAALDHGTDSIKDSDGPLIPFSMIVTDKGEKKLHRFLTDKLEEGVGSARNFVEKEKNNIKIYAIVWDGYITIENRKWEAVLVEAGERSKESGILLAQRYEKKGIFKKRTHLIGNPALVEKPTSRIYGT